MFWIELLVVLAAIFVGARIKGLGLGLMGGVGLLILTFVFGKEPTSPPIEVMLIILSVVSAAACLQASGGLDFLVSVAEKILRSNPKRLNYLAPVVCYVFTLVAGTGHVAYSVLPIISELALKTGIRPERPLSVSVIASQQAITASPISAATVALLALLSPQEITLLNILAICIPATLVGVLVAAFVSNFVGKELHEDATYLEKLKDPEFVAELNKSVSKTEDIPASAKHSVWVFLIAVVLIILFGSIKSIRPSWNGVPLDMTVIIEILMLSAAALILIVGKVRDSSIVSKGSIFRAGMEAVIAIFGIAWMGDTFIQGNYEFMESNIQVMVTNHSWTFAFALFVLSILLFSQAATVRALMPLGISLGIPAASLIAMFPAVNGYFFLPNYPTVIAAIGFDKTETTRIGKYVLNHSFMIPGLIACVVAVSAGFLLASVVL
ncbi:anaerobic C4-dicarboxylate transporter family protein [Bacteroides sp. 519]|uniref:anaerobic C4-dicarboxylate transporter family protein n=1 Tax=Bacteroides sp. 519 TaxID=2302937 RepID=UPI0013D6E09A|nr:anaerobic C4-dicarboxylate transporter [Bacteroides sp. 519]NDV59139.1 anaerobic C4-dicarboxylate transporter [Bacteroides sp. 519]